MHLLIKMFLVILGGLIFSFSSPSYGLWFIAWFGLVPLFVMLMTSQSIRESLFCSFLFGFTYNLNCLKWLFSMHPLTWLGLTNTESFIVSASALIVTALCSSFFYVLFGAVFLFVKYSIPVSEFKSIKTKIIITLFWLVIFNKLSGQEFILGFPWTLVEYSQYKNLYLIQIAEYFGSISISFLIVFFNLVISSILTWFFHVEKIGNRFISSKPGDLGAILGSVGFIILLVSGSIVVSVASYNFYKSKYSLYSKIISIAQGNLPIKLTRGKGLDIGRARRTYTSLIKNTNTELIIIPEGSLPTTINSNTETLYWIDRIAMKKDASVLAGTYCESKDFKITNCAVLKNPVEKHFNYYEKQRLVPFGEYVPMYNILPDYLKKFADLAIGQGFNSGNLNKPLNSKIGNLGVSICFEIAYPDIIRKLALEGSNILINISDLSWFSDDSIKKQFVSFAVFRAIENRKPLVIASNNGPSVFIDSNGFIKSYSRNNKNDLLVDWVKPNKKVTFYSKYGW